MTCIRRAQSFWTKCDCPPCALDTRRKHKLYSMGRITRVPSEQAWAILADRIDDGWTALALASACGLPGHYFSSLVADYRAGHRQAIGPNIAAAVVNMRTPTVGSINARGSRRRLRALARVGYGLGTLAAETGVGASTLAMIRNSNVRVTAARANTITDAYDRLHLTPGPDPQATMRAVMKGWPAPLAWTDIDDPNEQPCVGRSEHIYLADELAAEWDHFRRSGESIEQAARQLGVTVGAIEKAVERSSKRSAA